MLDSEKLYTYFDMYHGPISPSSNNYFECLCPICGRPKFAANFIYKTGKCWRGCFSGFLIDVIRIYHGISYFEADELVDSQEPGMLRIPAAVKIDKKAKIKLPLGYTPILEGSTNLAYRAREYLKERNFDLNYMDRLGVGYCNEEDPNPLDNYFGRIIIPFKRNGILVYFIGRDFIGDYNRYKNPSKEKCGVGKGEFFFNEEALFINKKVYLLEGWACAATIGAKGVSMQGSTPSVVQRNIILKSPAEELIIIPDASFYRQGLLTARTFMKYKKTKVVNIDQFQIDKIGKDVNEIGLDNVLNTEDKTQYMDTKFLLRQLRIYEGSSITH